MLYIVLFLHQTTTTLTLLLIFRKLYIVLFLHQTTTLPSDSNVYSSCISYYSYIKPQLSYILVFCNISCISYYSYIKPQLCERRFFIAVGCISYCSYIKPQLNTCALAVPWRCISYYSYIKPQLAIIPYRCLSVVYRTIPTSNHNLTVKPSGFEALYIVLFLHQTTTLINATLILIRCISYYSYIKPQPSHHLQVDGSVVYRTIPTSNHNDKYML